MTDKRKGGRPDEDTGVLTRTKPETEKPSMYKVLLLNRLLAREAAAASAQLGGGGQHAGGEVGEGGGAGAGGVAPARVALLQQFEQYVPQALRGRYTALARALLEGGGR